MRENNAKSLREMLAQLSNEQLNEMMRLELRKETPDKNAVELILGILEEREADAPAENDPRSVAAWETYQKRIREGVLRPKPKRRFRWGWLAASAAVLVLILAMVVPQRADAESFWETLDRWKNSILEFFGPHEDISELEYEFKTDNPGLQQVYDEAERLGIDRPLIPMWFEEAYDLMSCQVVSSPTVNRMAVEFTDGSKTAVFNIDIYREKVLHGYWGDGIEYDTYEKEGAKYKITRNNDRWVAIWTKDNVEYFLTIDCQEETLDQILDSIYGLEEQ